MEDICSLPNHALDSADLKKVWLDQSNPSVLVSSYRTNQMPTPSSTLPRRPATWWSHCAFEGAWRPSVSLPNNKGGVLNDGVMNHGCYQTYFPNVMDVCSMGHWLYTKSWVIPVVWSHHIGRLQYVAIYIYIYIYLSQMFKGFPVHPLKYQFANRLEWPCCGFTASIKVGESMFQSPGPKPPPYTAHGTWKKDRRSHHAWDMHQLGFKETLEHCDQPSCSRKPPPDLGWNIAGIIP